MAIAEVHIVPVGTPGPSMGDVLADSIRAARKEGLTTRVGPMGTVLEGEVPRLLEVAHAMHEAAFSRGLRRVVTTIVLDDRRDKSVTADEKVRAIERRLAGK
jgi:uncharacterized protein (TIGR00106 family)